MEKVEQYIKNYTRNCSNEIGYCHNKTRNHNHVFYPWLTPDQARRAVEIAKEELIEKVCEFLDNDLCCYIKAQDFTIEHQRLENDLKQAMNDERI